MAEQGEAIEALFNGFPMRLQKVLRNNPFSLHSEIGIRKRVLVLLIIIFVPLLLLQGFTFYRWYRESKEAEMQANLELARTISKTFDHFIKKFIEFPPTTTPRHNRRASPDKINSRNYKGRGNIASAAAKKKI